MKQTMTESNFLAKFQEQRLIEERIANEGLLPIVKEELSDLIELCDSANASKQEIKEINGMLQSIIPMVYTLLIDNRLEDLYSMMVLGFPEYYGFPDDDDTKLEWGGKAYALKQALENGTILNTLFNKQEYETDKK